MGVFYYWLSLKGFLNFAGVTQLVECKLPKLGVAGSNPVARFIFLFFKGIFLFCVRGRHLSSRCCAPVLRLSFIDEKKHMVCEV